MVILKDIQHLFGLPTDFAVVPRQGHTEFYYNQGGFIFLRPCLPTLNRMLAHLQSDAHLQFTQASLAAWRSLRARVPLPWNLHARHRKASALGSQLLADSKCAVPQAYAEQSFLDWFFKYTAWHLPMEYNLNFAFLRDNMTVGGAGVLRCPRALFLVADWTTENVPDIAAEVSVIHFANSPKPFDAKPGDPEWPYLCWQPQQYSGHHVTRKLLTH